MTFFKCCLATSINKAVVQNCVHVTIMKINSQFNKLAMSHIWINYNNENITKIYSSYINFYTSLVLSKIRNVQSSKTTSLRWMQFSSCFLTISARVVLCISPYARSGRMKWKQAVCSLPSGVSLHYSFGVLASASSARRTFARLWWVLVMFCGRSLWLLQPRRGMSLRMLSTEFTKSTFALDIS